MLTRSEGFDDSLLYAAVANGAKLVCSKVENRNIRVVLIAPRRGLVIMGAGAAQLRPSTQAVAAELFSKGIPVVAVARPASGTGVPKPQPGSV